MYGILLAIEERLIELSGKNFYNKTQKENNLGVGVGSVVPRNRSKLRFKTGFIPV